MECGTCTLCCTLLTVKDIGKPAGTECRYCMDRCSIYDNRPQGCRAFDCAYLQMDEVNIALRPDQCGVVFEKINDTLVLGLMDPKRNRYSHLNGQIKAFYEAGASIVLSRGGNPTVYPQNGKFPRDLVKEVNG